jgi:hypothetical protein
VEKIEEIGSSDIKSTNIKNADEKKCQRGQLVGIKVM